ncbi:bacillithiol system protein YtxJ [Chitinophaga costaii]|uniref:Bacillithiol system protein YtxJ n=1 Tax=Chitinophaga costaii TaxID=1335309 RepID=A0A1C4FVL3_9BACT|nr:bacillithiol system redox-active protein YtxJ [Chitinophaga costaii]PUZ27229.1 bacillithiol system redox-active protein YtxJ [Chitinophaga costaii]SCC59645.1 bacillithiol system protein YtxJ [Chitinophaga costaii]
MEWIPLTSEEQLAEINELSTHQPVAIFKHSTRCSISGMVKSRLARETLPANVVFYYLDLIQYRNLSNRIAEDYRITHESPQLLLIRDGKCVYHESHTAISLANMEENLTI